MRATSLTFVCLMAVLAMCQSASTGKDCKVCPTVYEPVCGKLSADAADKAVTFGSECVMKNQECESGKHYEELSKGECPGKAPVRLS